MPGIGRELFEQVGCVDAFVGAVGSAGMLMGVAERVSRQRDAKTRIIALEPAGFPTADHRQGRTASSGRHRAPLLAATP